MQHREWMDGATVSPGQSRCEAVKRWGVAGVSAGHLRPALHSHSHPFVTISSKTLHSPLWGQEGCSRDGDQGECLDCGDRLHTLGKGQLQALSPLSGCGMQLR